MQVLKGINIEIRKGECVCIIGPSGSGKSTFLRCLNLLEVPDEGEIIIEGESILEKRKDIDKYRENVKKNWVGEESTILSIKAFRRSKTKGCDYKSTGYEP